VGETDSIYGMHVGEEKCVPSVCRETWRNAISRKTQLYMRV